MPEGILREGDDIDMILNDVSLSKDILDASKKQVKQILQCKNIQEVLETNVKKYLKIETILFFFFFNNATEPGQHPPPPHTHTSYTYPHQHSS